QVGAAAGGQGPRADDLGDRTAPADVFGERTAEDESVRAGDDGRPSDEGVRAIEADEVGDRLAARDHLSEFDPIGYEARPVGADNVCCFERGSGWRGAGTFARI